MDDGTNVGIGRRMAGSAEPCRACQAPIQTGRCRCLKPYWGKPDVRNFREGGWNRPNCEPNPNRKETLRLRVRAPVPYPTVHPQPMMTAEKDSVIVAVRRRTKGRPSRRTMEPRTEPEGESEKPKHAPDTGPGKRFGYGSLYNGNQGCVSRRFSTISRSTRCAGRSSR